MRFIHHPDKYVVIDGLNLPLDFFEKLEPDYSLHSDFISRVYDVNVRNVLVRRGTGKQFIMPIPWDDGDYYLSRVEDYKRAYYAYRDGATVYNDDGKIVIVWPPTLTYDQYHHNGKVENDGKDTIVITADVDDNTYVGTATWIIVAPNGDTISEEEKMIAGVSSLSLTTTQEGGHSVTVKTDKYGSSSISVEGI